MRRNDRWTTQEQRNRYNKEVLEQKERDQEAEDLSKWQKEQHKGCFGRTILVIGFPIISGAAVAAISLILTKGV